MRMALLADIHANLPAFKAVLQDLEKKKITQIFHAGDIVGYNPFPNECVELVRRHKIESVKGNHDNAVITGDTSCFNPVAAEGIDWTVCEISGRNKKFLEQLPLSLSFKSSGLRVKIVHGSPDNHLEEYVFLLGFSKKRLKAFVKDCDILVLGHTHIPMLINIAGKIIVNPGSVGQPRDGDCRASYAVLDTEKPGVENCKVGYDVQRTAKAVREAGLPEELAERLFTGW